MCERVDERANERASESVHAMTCMAHWHCMRCMALHALHAGCLASDFVASDLVCDSCHAVCGRVLINCLVKDIASLIEKRKLVDAVFESSSRSLGVDSSRMMSSWLDQFPTQPLKPGDCDKDSNQHLACS